MTVVRSDQIRSNQIKSKLVLLTCVRISYTRENSVKVVRSTSDYDIVKRSVHDCARVLTQHYSLQSSFRRAKLASVKSRDRQTGACWLVINLDDTSDARYVDGDKPSVAAAGEADVSLFLFCIAVSLTESLANTLRACWRRVDIL